MSNAGWGKMRWGRVWVVQAFWSNWTVRGHMKYTHTLGGNNIVAEGMSHTNFLTCPQGNMHEN